jgi:septum site-determining protein MinC
VRFEGLAAARWAAWPPDQSFGRENLSQAMASSTARPGGLMRLRGRSYLAFALSPEPPIADWIADLDQWLRTSPGFFVGRPTVLDLSAVTLTAPGLSHLIAELGDRGIRIMGLEGAAAEKLGPGLPPLLAGGRPAPAGAGEQTPIQPTGAPQPEPRSLVIEANIRSGQSVFFPEGDVVVLGSVSSGAEVAAGGCIHIYGTLRGRALAGTTGNRAARIFSRRLEAELVAIDGYYRSDVILDAELRGRPAQTWLAGEMLMIAAMDK